MSYWIDKETGKELKLLSDLPLGSIGFIYLIELSNGKKYIGKKNLRTKRKRRFGKKEIAKITDKRKKHWEWVIKESDWKTYISSNNDVKKDISKGVQYKKYIIDYAFKKKELSYKEEKQLFSKGVIEKREYYNSNIAGRYFPKDVVKE